MGETRTRGNWPGLSSLGLEVWDFGFVIFPLALLWRPLFGGEAFFWGTPLLQFVPWQRMSAAMWRAGHLPLWNPLVGCGAPLAANYQTAAFYPLGVLALLLPVELALSWTTAFHLALAGWGMYRWGRAAGLDQFPSFIGALSLMGGGFLVTRVALFPSIAFTFPWMAVWLWRTEVLVQRGRLRDAIWLGLAIGLGLLAGHAQTAFYGGLLVGAYVVFRTLQMARRRTQAIRSKRLESAGWSFVRRVSTYRPVLLVLCAVVVGCGLAAVQLLPTAELLSQSRRVGGVTYDFAMTYSLWPWRLITVAAPDFFGHPGQGDYWGYATYWEDAGYIGTLPLLLAAGAIVGARLGRARNQWRKQAGAGQVCFWTICALIGWVLALGKNTPVFPLLFHHVPGFDLFQAPARWLAVTSVALAGLAALGAHQWPVGRPGQRQGALWAVIGVALIAGGLAAPRLVPNIRPTFGSATVRLGIALTGAGGVALLRRGAAARRGTRGQAWWQLTVGALVALDLLLLGWPSVPTVDRSLYRGQTEAAAALRGEPGAVRVYWPTDPGHLNRAFDAEQRVKFGYLDFGDFGPQDADYWWEMRELLLPNVGMLDGVASANNYDPLLVGRYTDLLDAVTGQPALLRVMGVSHVASDGSWPEGAPIQMGMPASLYRLSDALGRAWVVPAARQVSSDEVLAALADPAFNPTAEVLLETPPISRPASQSPISNPQSLTLRDTPNRVTIDVILSEPGYLVLADTWYPGWQAMVDGEAVPLLRANHAFRAVSLEAGEHTVEMRYRSASVRWGGAVSIVTLIGLMLGLVLLPRRGC